MRWRTFFQIVLILAFLIAGIYRFNPIRRLTDSGLYPFRYQALDREPSEMLVSLVDPQTGKRLHKYIPTEGGGVFDTWTGKTYTVPEFPKNTIFETDVLNKKLVAHPIESDLSSLSIDWKEAEEWIAARLKHQEDTKRNELIKSYLQGK